jgi:hypothetical protein
MRNLIKFIKFRLFVLMVNLELSRVERQRIRAGRDADAHRRFIKREMSLHKAILNAYIAHYNATGKTYRALA